MFQMFQDGIKHEAHLQLLENTFPLSKCLAKTVPVGAEEAAAQQNSTTRLSVHRTVLFLPAVCIHVSPLLIWSEYKSI